MTKAAGVTNRNVGKVERRTKTMVSRVDKQFSGLAKSIGGVGKTFPGGLAGGMFIGGLEGLSRGVRSVVSELSGIANVSGMEGIATDDLQRLRYGFETTGFAADHTDTALRRFARRVGEAANGSGVLHDALKNSSRKHNVKKTL